MFCVVFCDIFRPIDGALDQNIDPDQGSIEGQRVIVLKFLAVTLWIERTAAKHTHTDHRECRS